MRECVTQFGPLVWSIARRMHASDVEAEATCQEIFVELWQHVGRYDPRAASEQVFVTMIARRCVIERQRNTVPRPPPRAVPDSMSSAEPAASERSVEASIATGVLATLDPRQRRAVSMAIGQAMTYGEVADANDMTIGSAKSLLRRALVAVRKRVQARQGEAP